MGEVYTLVEGKSVNYKGLVDCKSFLKHIDTFFRSRGYLKRETKSVEEVLSSGKQIIVEFFPYKPINDYVKFEIRVFIVFVNIKDVEVTKSGKKLHIQQGEVKLEYDVFMTTDYENKWEGRAWLFFMRNVFDQLVYKNQISVNKAEVLKDAADMEEEVKGYLNMMKYR